MCLCITLHLEDVVAWTMLPQDVVAIRAQVRQLSTVFNRAIDAFKRRRVGEEFVEIEFHRASNERGWSFVRTATSQRTRENVDKHAGGVADCDGRS